jgi:aminoglycoside/choline kinase family phosphotransferase
MSAATPFANAPDARLSQIGAWLRSLPVTLALEVDTLRPASSDASFRRYWRLAAGDRSLIVMDAPLPHEDTRPFLHVAALLRDAGLNVPAVLAQNVENGLLLLSDLGHETYYERIQTGLADDQLQRLYRDALQALVRLQHAAPTGLAQYDATRLRAELMLFTEWYVAKHHKTTLDGETYANLGELFTLLSVSNASEPTVLVHRDFHSPNLMVSDNAAYGINPGIIDFQDALAGPITYDIASLVTDARTTWDEAQQLDWAIRYWEMARAAKLPLDDNFAEFHRAYEWMGLQRNLRILGVFARLYHRDGKPDYLAHMPRVLAYVRQVAQRYAVFTPLLRLLAKLEEHEVTVGYTF